MSSWATASIAGVALEVSSVSCKNMIMDGANVQSDHIGVNRWSAAGTVFTQVLDLSVGAKFGIKSAFITKALLDSVVAAINSAMNGGAGSFNVTAADAIQSINKTVVPDYEAGLISYSGEQRADALAIKDVVFRFVVAA